MDKPNSPSFSASPMTMIEFHTFQEPIVKQKQHEDGTIEDFHIYDCMFCGKEKHLYYFPKTTTWDCKVCGKHGNVHDFNRLLYTSLCQNKIEDIASWFDMPRRVFEKIKWNPLGLCYVIPTFRNNKLNNLYKYNKDTNVFYGTPGLGATLYDWSDDSYDTIWLCEGHKDKMAAEAILGSGKEITAIGIPGANSFKSSWCQAFQDKEVILMLDKDDAGIKGTERIINIFKTNALKPRKISTVVWPPEEPEGYDLRDFWNKHKGASYKNIHYLIEPIQDESAIKVTSETVLEDYNCNTYDKAIESFTTAYHLTKDMECALALILASIYSINIDGEQLWLKIIGPPGCGKTAIAKGISASDYVINKSTFTGLFSGWRDVDDEDPSLVPLIQGRTLVVKDADALLKQANIEKIMSELRDFYDKNSSVHYNNKKSYNYQDIRSTFIMMGTQVLRRADQSFLGERLLTVEMDVSPIDENIIKRKVMQRTLAVATGKIENPEAKIMASMKGFINHLRERELDSTLPEEFQEDIMSVCSLTALLRTQVDRDFKGKVRSPAMPEIPSRLIGQSFVAALALCAVYGVQTPSEHIYKICMKMLKDTMNPRSHRFAICDTIMENPRITAGELMEATRFDKNIIYHEILDLIELSFIKPVKLPGQTPGRSVNGYVLKDTITGPLKKVISL